MASDALLVLESVIENAFARSGCPDLNVKANGIGTVYEFDPLFSRGAM
jgi:hypothetical protein